MSTISAHDLLTLREIGGYSGNLSVSPDGRLVAFQMQQAKPESNRWQLDWYIVPIDGGSPLHLGPGGEVMLNYGGMGRINGSRAEIKARWSPDSRWIAYRRKDGGEIQVWRSRVDGSLQEQVTNNAADVMNFDWMPDGKGIYFQVGRNREAVRRAQQAEGKRGFLVDTRFSPGYSLKPLWFECGEATWLVPVPESQACTPETWIVEFPGGHERKATPKEERAYTQSNKSARPESLGDERAIQQIVWDDDHSHAAWLENESPDTYPGFAAPLTLFAANRRCPASECHGQIKRLWWSGENVVFLRREGHGYGLQALYSWRPDNDIAQLIYRLDGVLQSCEISVSANAAICLHEEPTAPRKIVVIDPDNGAVGTVYDPNPDFARFQLGAVERLEWEDAYGNETFGHLVYPVGYKAGNRYPLVIVQYRSKGFLKGGVGEEYPVFPLSAAGFAVLSFDVPEDRELLARYRSDEPGKSEAEEWKDAYEKRRAVTALDRIIDSLDRRGIVDPDRVGITGLSHGAEVTSFALFNNPDQYAAAAVSGDSAPTYYWLANKGMRSFLRTMLDAETAHEALETWKKISLLHNAAKVQTPLLVQVSDTELIMSYPNLVALQDAGKTVEYYTFPDEYHIKWQPQHKLAVYRRSIQWFRFWLMGLEESDPIDPLQYARWRKMRDGRDAQANVGTKSCCPAN